VKTNVKNSKTVETYMTSLEQTALLDSGCTSHFIKQGAPQNIKKQNNAPCLTVRFPNNATIKSSGTGTLCLPELNLAATKNHTFNNLNKNLMSVGQLCDAGYDVHFDKDKAIVNNKENIILTAPRDHKNGLWQAPLVTTNNEMRKATCNMTTHHDNTTSTYLRKHDNINSAYCSNVQDHTDIKDAINYLQGAAFSPVKSTLLQAIENGNVASRPGFTTNNVAKHYTRTIATAKFHMVQTRQNTRSMKPKKQKKAPTEEMDDATREDFAPKDNLPQRTHEVYTTITDINGKVYTDLTGRFPTTSSKGNKYILVLYEYDGNVILAGPMKTKADAEAVRAYTLLYRQLTNARLRPNFQIMDNEASTAVKYFLKQNNIAYQLVPTHIHRRNAAERAIHTFKSHFVAGLATTDGHFPMHLWCQLVHQTTITLNLLQKSRLKKIVSLPLRLRPLQLRRNPTGTTRNTNFRPRKTKKTGNMGRSWSLRMVYRTGVGTLLMLQGIHNRNGR
jgi:hypothetical protein